MTDKKQIGGTHYKDMDIQPWDVMQSCMSKEEFRGFLRGNAIKYIMRAGHKGSFKQDIEKAMHYLEKLIEVETLTREQIEQISYVANYTIFLTGMCAPDCDFVDILFNDGTFAYSCNTKNIFSTQGDRIAAYRKA